MNATITARMAAAAFAGLVMAASLGGAAGASDAVEETYWSIIRSRTDAQAFENYLARYPHGAHAGEAKMKLHELAAPPAAGTEVAPGATAAMPASNARSAEALIEKAAAAQSAGDLAAAARLYGEAADAGSAIGHLQLGYMLLQGDGIAQNQHEAVRHFEAAARLGDADGCAAAIGAKDVDSGAQSTYDPAGAARLILLLATIDASRAVNSLGGWSGATLAILQQLLANDGHYSASIDGKTGPGTRAALVAYASAHAAPASAGETVAGIVVTADGVGGINSRTPFDADVLRGMLPGYEIVVKKTSNEGMTTLSFVVRLNGQDMIEIDGDQGKVFTMRIVGAGIADDRGMTIGSSTFADFTGSVEQNCMAIEERDGTAVACQSEIPALTYSFASPEPVRTDSDGILHRSGVPSQSLLTHMIWYPTD